MAELNRRKDGGGAPFLSHVPAAAFHRNFPEVVRSLLAVMPHFDTDSPIPRSLPSVTHRAPHSHCFMRPSRVSGRGGSGKDWERQGKGERSLGLSTKPISNTNDPGMVCAASEKAGKPLADGRWMMVATCQLSRYLCTALTPDGECITIRDTGQTCFGHRRN